MRSVLFVIGFLFGIAPINAQYADALLGDWLTEDGKARVSISVNNNKYRGIVTWVRDSNDSNKIEMLVLSDFVYDAKEREWNNGVVYDPKHGHNAAGYLKLEDINTLKVVGYKAFRWLSDSETWKRAETSK